MWIRYMSIVSWCFAGSFNGTEVPFDVRIFAVPMMRGVRSFPLNPEPLAHFVDLHALQALEHPANPVLPVVRCDRHHELEPGVTIRPVFPEGVGEVHEKVEASPVRF